MARKYTPVQNAALAILSDLHVEKVTNRALIRKQIEAAFQDRLIDLELRESRAANECISLGLPKTVIGRAMGTANFKTITDCLARTAGDVTIGDLVPKTVRYEWVAWEKIRVRMDGPEFEAWVKAKENTSRFRVGGFAAEKTDGVYWVTNGEVGTQAIGCEDHSTRNTFDRAVTGWLQSREGRADVQVWMANNAGPAEGETA